MNVKRLISLVVCVLPMMALSACGGGTSTDNSVQKSVPLTPAPTNRVAETGSSHAKSPSGNEVGGKGVTGTVPDSAKSETQNNVNELVNDINALH